MTLVVFRAKAPIVMAQLMADFPFDVEDAAAIMGNAGHESGGLTNFQEDKPTVPGSRGGYGWFQWTGPRRVAFENWCKRKGLEPTSDEANYGFLCHELRGTEKRAVAAVGGAKGLEAKVEAFERAFERSGVKAYASRLKWAQRALVAYQDAAPAPRKPTTPLPTPPDVEPVAAKPSNVWGQIVAALIALAMAAIGGSKMMGVW